MVYYECVRVAYGTAFPFRSGLGRKGVGEAKEEENEVHEQWPPRRATGRPLYGPAGWE